MAAPLAPLSPSSSLDHPFRNLTTLFPRRLKPTHFIPKASSSSDPDPEPPKQATSSTDEDPFESRLAQVRLRYRSGTGKKAEIRKEKKGKRSSEAGSGSGGVLLPPVPLKEPMSGGVKVEFGFSPYSERVNGRLAGLGLVALLLVEVATGKSVLNYHTPAIVFIQLYFMAAMCAVFLKYEKEKVSVWPFGSDASNSTANNDV